MMKVIIQIPCFNEEGTLVETINDLPKKLEGVDTIETLVINDGSSDNTVAVARKLGVDHILDLPVHRGLAEAFRRGLERALELGADIIVNTDGDNQYKGSEIKKLIGPILARRAEIVIGCRDIANIKHFSPIKKLLQRMGSYVVRVFSNTDIPDTTSGFRAFSRDAAFRVNVFSTYTYTLETIIQAGRKEIPLTHVMIATNKKLRDSRLIKSIPAYIKQSVVTMLRIYVMYEPLKTFFTVGLLLMAVGLIPIGRFIVDHFLREHGGHIQSVIIGSMMIVVGFISLVVGLVGDIISANR